VTETIWQTLAWEKGSLLATSDWPTGLPKADNKAAQAFEDIKTIVTEVRGIARDLKTQELILRFNGVPFLTQYAATIAKLAKITVTESNEAGQGIKLLQTTYPAWIAVSPEAAKKYAEELATQKTIQTNSIAQLKKRLNNKSYVANAPAAVVDQTKAQLTGAERLLDNIAEQQKRFTQS